MGSRHSFYYTGFPRLRAYVVLAGIAGCALALTASATASGSIGLFVAAAAAWVLLVFLCLALVRQVGVYLGRKPAITIDEDGISLPRLIGAPRHHRWSAVTELELKMPGDRCSALLRGACGLVVIPLSELNVEPMSVWDALRGCRHAAWIKREQLVSKGGADDPLQPTGGLQPGPQPDAAQDGSCEAGHRAAAISGAKRARVSVMLRSFPGSLLLLVATYAMFYVIVRYGSLFNSADSVLAMGAIFRLAARRAAVAHADQDNVILVSALAPLIPALVLSVLNRGRGSKRRVGLHGNSAAQALLLCSWLAWMATGMVVPYVPATQQFAPVPLLIANEAVVIALAASELWLSRERRKSAGA